jgi:hypothetical protein
MPPDSITLIAMSPAGSTLVVRDEVARVWLYPPEGAGHPQVIDPETMEQAIARGDLERVGREFESWGDLDAFRQQRAAQATPDETVYAESFDLDDVESMIEVAERWLSEGNGERARLLAFRLLRVPIVRADSRACDRVLGLLERYGRPSLPLHTQPPTSLQAEARDRWELARAA